MTMAAHDLLQEARSLNPRQKRLWLALVLALGLLAVLWLALGWQRAVRAEINDVSVSFVDHTVESSEADCGVGMEMIFLVNAIGDGPYPTSVNFEVIAGGDGTATPNVDFVAATGSVTVVAPPATSEIKVQIVCDGLDEPAEQFAVRLLPTGNVGVVAGTAIATIQDDDIPQVSINEVTLQEGSGPAVMGSLTLAIDPVPYRNVNLTVRTLADTASPESSWQLITRPLVVPAGATSLPLGVTIYGDLVDEVDDLERFFVELTSPVPEDIAVSGGLSGTVYIQDDDFAGFEVEPASLVINEDEAAMFQLSLETVPEYLVKLDITPQAGANSRLQVLTETVTFSQGAQTLFQPFAIQGVDNALTDAPERFKLFVSPASSADVPYKNLGVKEVIVEVRDADTSFLFTPTMLFDYRIPFDYVETFDTSASLAYWQLLNGEHEWQNEAYVLKQLNSGFNTRSIAPVPNITVDYSVEVDVFVPESADPYTRVGILFDFKSNVEFYRFVIRPAVSEYRLERFSLNQGYTSLAFGTSTAINGGHGLNKLRIERRGGQIWLYVNDLQMNTSAIVDTTYQYGRVGLIIVAPDTFVNTPLAAGQFDDFSVLEIDD
jgi:hypothetical protein